MTLDQARQYLAERWAAFLDLGPSILDLQHRAAEVAFAAGEAGDTERKEQAQAIIRALGKLNVMHGELIDRMRDVAQFVGLGMGSFSNRSLRAAGTLGALPAVPVWAVTVIVGVGTGVAAFFAKYAAQVKALNLLEAGTLTPEGYDAIVRAGGGSPIAEASGLVRLLLIGGAAWAAWSVWNQAGRPLPARKNPPLVVWGRRNPPEDGGAMFGSQVHQIRYRHASDGGNWFHDFAPGVQMFAEPDGSVSIRHRDGRRVWEDF